MKKTIDAKEKRWIIRSADGDGSETAISKIAEALGINPIVAKLLYNRGYTDPESAKTFIYMESEMLSDPFKMKDIEKGIARVRRAVESGERITVYGDYDVDGVTAVCTLYLYLKSLGANVDYYIPNRIGEGYGVSVTAIDQIVKTGASLIITVDTGITAIDEVNYAKDLGIDFVITDHHECRSELPEAEAVINPHRPDCEYPFKELAGVGVVFKFVCAYEEKVCGSSRRDAAMKIFSEYADLVAIGTIADVMPIREENRIIVRYGLLGIENNKRLGLCALMDAASNRQDGQRSSRAKHRAKITSGYIGYTIAPRINAAGRIKNASIAVELFLSEDRAKAAEIAEILCKTNKERQNEENKIMQEASEKIVGYDIEKNPVIVLDADNWHHGVIGIVSSRITEKYSRPSILVSFEGNEGEPSAEDVGKGSGRSIKGMNLVDALCYCEAHLVKFGGHELAAGLSVKRGELDTFRRKINEFALANLTEEDMIPIVEADCSIKLEDVNLSLAKAFQMLEPYGVSNPVPVFVMQDITVSEISGISDGKHTKMVLSSGKYSHSAMYFSNSPSSLGIYPGDKVDVLFNIDINEWMGRESVQLIVRDIRPSKSMKERYASNRERFEQIKAGAPFSATENIMPTREDFIAVYNVMRSSLRAGVNVLTHRDITSKFNSLPEPKRIGYIKLKIIIMVLKELNLVSLDEISDEVYKFDIHYTTGKTDLEKSTWLRRFRSQMARSE
ncbi:MAG: single-stranded-DNA-specific exonuclease RecJ [Clostridia bacterium]|nr:single-stranded-DNA-specific exonuclease RecJ [Clostridia bacterium]